MWAKGQIALDRTTLYCRSAPYRSQAQRPLHRRDSVMTTTDAARALQALRRSRKGGRPRSAAPRCPCGAMTAARAAARGHRCLPPATTG